MTDTVTLRIRVLAPPDNHVYSLQKGKAGTAVTEAVTATDGSDLTFELTMTVKEGKVEDTTNFGGPFAQGSPSDRFFYLCVDTVPDGASTGGRIKVPVYMIPWRMVTAVLEGDDLVLEASFDGVNEKGRIALATVPLVDGGWLESPA
ncbi:MAG: hypothetical protein CMQ05_13705 [Gammaproteobacteria bacterium]|nr:hypothetical protein [Gammaproteobacteria bacterium]RPG23864.1 MAG: hypothetical protein CBC10_013325 [Gammaproteobacteria bacterium TMED50]|tara:strand:- start:7170 stop:7610 length:441 start_codon:yes stop_codon:yes gene_type:complete